METSVLKEILDQHKLWIETNGMQGTSANLINAKLWDANLHRAILTDANLRGANLNRADLTDANLRGADLRGANLNRADLTDANLRGADLYCADLYCANLTGANLTGAYLCRTNLTNTILPDISWIKAGCLVQLNKNMHGFYLKKEDKWENFVQDSLGFFIQNNVEEETFDMLVEDRIIRNIPYWVKYTGLRQIESESV